MDFGTWFSGVATDFRIWALLGLIALNFVLGVSESLKAGSFDWKKIGDFYTRHVAPMLIGYIAVHAVIDFVPGMTAYVADGAQWVAFAPLAVSLVSSIAQKFTYVFGVGLPVPPRE